MKKFELLSTEPIHGAINIPVLNKMTNKDVAEAILRHVESEEIKYSLIERAKIERYCDTFLNETDGLFIDPCENCEDCFVLAFGFKSYTRDAAIFFSVFAFALFGESIVNLML